jgi:hypothetical protein
MQEHGTDFAASAAMQAIAAIAASELFNLVYARCATVCWPLTLMPPVRLVAGRLAAAGLTLTLPSPGHGGLAVLINSICLPRPALSGAVAAVNETLGLRMLAAAVLTLLASLAASKLGALERVLAVFPLLAVVMAVATQRAQGSRRCAACCWGGWALPVSVWHWCCCCPGWKGIWLLLAT